MTRPYDEITDTFPRGPDLPTLVGAGDARALLEKATPGPWFATTEHHDERPGTAEVCDLVNDLWVVTPDQARLGNPKADAALIAAAPSLAFTVIDQDRAIQGLVQAIKDRVKEGNREYAELVQMLRPHLVVPEDGAGGDDALHRDRIMGTLKTVLSRLKERDDQFRAYETAPVHVFADVLGDRIKASMTRILDETDVSGVAFDPMDMEGIVEEVIKDHRRLKEDVRDAVRRGNRIYERLVAVLEPLIGHDSRELDYDVIVGTIARYVKKGIEAANAEEG